MPKPANGHNETRVFSSTQWSLVARAGSADSPGVREAMDALLRRYMPAMRLHLLMDRRVSPDQADDLLQGFISDRMIERNLVGMADRARGKFRTFLLKSVDRYCIDQKRAQQALKRAPEGRIQGLDDVAFAVAGPDESDVRDAAFDAEWARQVLAEAVERMRIECDVPEKVTMWGIFQKRILRPAFEAAPPADYDELVREYALTSPTQAANLLVTAKRMLVRNLRAVIGEYAEDEAEVDQEMNELREVLAGLVR